MGRTYRVAKWLKNGYVSLVEDRTEQTGFYEISALGYETVSRILWARHRLYSKALAIPDPDAPTTYLVGERDLRCGSCWRSRGQWTPVSPGGVQCSTCNKSYATEATVINRTYSSLRENNKMPKSEISHTELVTKKVEEVFREELEEAKRDPATTE